MNDYDDLQRRLDQQQAKEFGRWLDHMLNTLYGVPPTPPPPSFKKPECSYEPSGLDEFHPDTTSNPHRPLLGDQPTIPGVGLPPDDSDPAERRTRT